MQISKRVVDKDLNQYIANILVSAFSHSRNSESVDHILSDLLTDTERVVIAKRLAIALLLIEGYGYNQVCSVLKVSPPTVAKVKTWLNSRGEGFRTILKQVKNDRQLRGFWERLDDLVI